MWSENIIRLDTDKHRFVFHVVTLCWSGGTIFLCLQHECVQSQHLNVDLGEICQVEQEVAGNINNFKRPSLHGDIYRVLGGGGRRGPRHPSSLWDTLAGAEEWVENSTGWREKVVEGVGGGHKLDWRQLITSMASADAKTPHPKK